MRAVGARRPLACGAVLATLSSLWLGAAWGEQTPVGIHPSPLQDLPSEEGAHLQQIRELAPGAWLDLGPPAADPRFGVAYGASWGGNALQYDPVGRGAYRAGEGRHAFVKPDGYGQDDFWFYDIHQHRWLCLYPGTNTHELLEQVKQGRIAVDEVGRPVTPGGGTVPGHLLIHGFGYLAVNTDTGRLRVFAEGGFNRYYMPGVSRDRETREYSGDVHEAITRLEAQGLGQGKRTFGPWAYDPESGDFLRPLAKGSLRKVGGYPAFVYLPAEKKFFLAGRKGQAYFDPQAGAWQPIKARGEGLQGYDFGAAVDTERNRVYVGRDEQTLSFFSVARQAWVKVDPSGAPQGLTFSANAGGIYYHSRQDVMVVFSFESRRMAYLDPERNEWLGSHPIASDFAGKRTNAVFYDPELDVFFIYTASDSRANGSMWVHRVKAIPAVER